MSDFGLEGAPLDGIDGELGVIEDVHAVLLVMLQPELHEAAYLVGQVLGFGVLPRACQNVVDVLEPAHVMHGNLGTHSFGNLLNEAVLLERLHREMLGGVWVRCVFVSTSPSKRKKNGPVTQLVRVQCL